MKQKIIDDKILSRAQPIFKDQIKTVYQFQDCIWDIYNPHFLKQFPSAITIDFEKINYLETINHKQMIIPNTLLLNKGNNMYLGYETKRKNLKSFEHTVDKYIDDIDSITDYYMQITRLIEFLHQYNIVIPSLFWYSHLFINPDTDQVYISNLVNAQITEYPSFIVDPKLFILHKYHLPNCYLSQFLLHPNSDYISIMNHYFYCCTHVDLLASFCCQMNQPEVIPAFFKSFGLNEEVEFQNTIQQLFSNRELKNVNINQYFRQLLNHYELENHPTLPNSKVFVKVKEKARNRN